MVAAVLYVLDAAKLVPPSEVLLVESRGGRFVPRFSGDPFTLAGRSLLFAPLVQPYRGVFLAPWGGPWTDGPALDVLCGALRTVRRRLRVVRGAATTGFAILFLVGPFLTSRLGADRAILYTAAALYPLLGLTVAALWWQRRALGLSRRRCAWLGVEIVVCPAFLPNLVRKITTIEPLAADAAQLVLVTASPGVVAAFVAALERRVEQYGGDEILHRRLSAYVASFAGAAGAAGNRP